MSNIRDGNEKVYFLKKEVERSVEYLETTGYMSNGEIIYKSRVKRQIEDGLRFLDMLKEPAYSGCKTLDELKFRISKRRNVLKRKLVKLDSRLEGHQMTIFDMMDDVSEHDRNKRLKEIESLKEEIHWLHKCLGICKSRNYFK